MNSKIKILVGLLVTGIILISGWFTFNRPSPEEYGDTVTEFLQLTINSDKEEYKVGEEIKVFYTIENKNSEGIGFYVSDFNGLNIEVTDLAGKTYNYYFDVSAQRFMLPLYPDRYVFLEPNEKWSSNKSFALKSGEIKTWSPGGNLTWKEQSGSLETIYDGLYIDCLSGCLEHDSILLDQFSKGNIQISSKYKTKNPNPTKYTLKDCNDANISIDIFREEIASNEIYHSVSCEGGACPGLDDEIRLGPSRLLEINNLAIYCQHHSALDKNAWIGTLNSNTIMIQIK
ncbi:MAG: hypothetical protein AABX33_08170 [Nanoarchaeota archaeon]